MPHNATARSHPADHEHAPNLVAAVAGFLDEREASLPANVVRFARLLRAAGFVVTAGRVLDAARALAAIGVEQADDLRAAFRAVFLTEHEQAATFDLLFDLYWRDPYARLDAVPLVAEGEPEAAPPRPAAAGRSGLLASAARAAADTGGDQPEGSAGAADLITAKDFATYTDHDLARARRLIRALAPKLASALTRRRHATPRRGEVDLRRSVRRSIRHGGEVIELLHRRRRVRRLRLTLLCDVSGSMDIYSRQIVQFLYALQSELRGVHTFVFSTRLHDITRLLKTRTYDEALRRVGRDLDLWSGGTSIGRSLAEFERRHARRTVDSRTVVIIISDGWERGEVEELREAMRALKRRAFRILWLNPLLGHPEYRPVARGMAAALPYTDAFLPAHSLEALTRVARTLASIGEA